MSLMKGESEEYDENGEMVNTESDSNDDSSDY